MKNILLIPHIKVRNANALSSPYTIGFPAMTAWLGAIHALERKLKSNWNEISFLSIGVISHDFNLHIYKGYGDYNYSIIGTGNPLKKDGKRPSFIEEPRCDLDVSIIVEILGVNVDDHDDFIEDVYKILISKMKMASGDILFLEKPEIYKIKNETDFKELKRKLMPGFIIIERRDLMIQSMNNGLDGVDALLEYLQVFNISEKKNEQVNWMKYKKTNGWIIPIAVGFHGLTKVDFIKNQRDPETPHCFAESVVTLGEFKMSYHFNKLNEMLWFYQTDLENNLYLCTQKQLINKKGE